MRNRRLAEERRLARLKDNTFNSLTNSNAEVSSTTIDLTSVDKGVENQNDSQTYRDIRVKKTKKSQVIDSDDDDDVSNSEYMEVDATQNKDDSNANETSKIGNNTNDINFNSQSNKVAQNEATELIDITEGYEFRNSKTNHNINEVIDLVNTEVQDTNVIIGNNDLNSSDDDCDVNSVNVSVTVDVHKGDSKNSDTIEKYSNKEILEKSIEITEKELSENNKLVEDVPNETEINKENLNTNEENANINKENVCTVNEKAGSKELGANDKENIGCNVAQSVGLDDFMDVDFSNDF